MPCLPTYKGKRYNSLDDLYNNALDDTKLKAVEYTSSTDQRINNVITAGKDYAKTTLINFVTRAAAFKNNAALNTSIDDLKKLGIQDDIVDTSLANFAKALTIILEYQHSALLAPKEIGKTGGIMYRLEEFEKIPMHEILSTPRGRKDFVNFMQYALTFLKGYQNIETLKTVQNADFTIDEKVINDLITEIQALAAPVNNAMAKYNSLLQSYFETDLAKYTSNPDIIDGIRRMFDPGDDESYTQYLLDSMADTNNSFVASLIKKLMIYDAKGQEEWRKEIGSFEALLRKVFNKEVTSLTEDDFTKYFEIVNGKRSGKLVQKYDMNKFIQARKAYFADIIKKYGKGTDMYAQKSREWYETHETSTISEEEVLAIMAQKKAELSSFQYDKWEYDNFFKGSIKMGNAGFKTPSDLYINPEWNKIKDDELYQYLVKTLSHYAEYFGRENILTKGYIPTMTTEDRTSLLDNIKDPVAWYHSHRATKKSDTFVGENNEMQYILTIPMINFFSKEDTIPIRPQKQNEDFKLYQKDVIDNAITKGFGVFDSIKAIQEKNKEIIKLNEEHHASKITYNLAEILPNFIKEATRYKYKHELEPDVKLALHQTKNLILNNRTPEGDLAKNKPGTKLTGVPVYQTKTGEGSNLQKHLSEWLEAVFYGNFDIDEGDLTKISKILLKYTSAKNMWFNMTAGISNVAFGKLQIKLERVAGWYFTTEDMRKADLQYIRNIPDMLINHGSTKAETLINGIIKMLDVAQNTNEKDFSTGMMHKQFMSSSTAYFMNDMGEHYMQNITLLSMLNHHKVIDGQIVSLAEYKHNNYKNALLKILSPEEQSNLEVYLKRRYTNEKFKENKKDYLYEFILGLPIDKKIEFTKIKAELDKTTSTEFNTHPSAIDIFYLDEQGLAQVHETIEHKGKTINVKLNENEYENFRVKVVHVNQKAQGIYNTEDASTASRRAIGKMLMQFKKFMRPGWNKRFGTKFGRSFWTESREEWDKGMYVSLFQFLKTPFKSKYNEVGEAEVFHKMMGKIISDMGNFATNIRLNWNLLDDFEKGNIRRTLLEFAYLGAVMLAAALLAKVKPDDDEPDLAYDILVYEVDRIMGELMLYNPSGIGLINESKKMIKSPAAVQGTVIDLSKFMGSLIGYPFQSDEERRYKSNVYRDELRLKVNAMKLVPIVNKYQQLKRINTFNKYYILFRG